MRIIVTGKDGLLGKDCVDALSRRGHEVKGCGRKEFNLENEKQTRDFLVEWRPEAVVHLAAVHAIDYCELHPEEAYSVNVAGTRNVILGCLDCNCEKLIFASSAVVFDGDKKNDASYTELDQTHPINNSGKTKVLAEKLVQSMFPQNFIVRLPLLFGSVQRPGLNPLLDIIGDIKSKGEVIARRDEYVSISYTAHIARTLADLLETSAFGIYHVSNTGIVSRADFARKIADLLGAGKEVVKEISLQELNNPGKRLKNSSLASIALRSAGVDRLPGWEEALRECFNELEQKGAI